MCLIICDTLFNPYPLMNLRLLLTVFALSAASLVGSSARLSASFSNESLSYKVMYKWGLINKKAGTATLSLRNEGDRYSTLLTARSEPWADKFYRVRDTLSGSIIRENFLPVFYEKRSHEGSDNKHDVVNYRYTGSRILGICTRRHWDKHGKLTKDEKRTLEAQGTTVDMLSSFYYMRALPFADWKPGNVTTINIFSGKRKELLTIKYIGIDDVEYDKRSYRCYHIRFTFSDEERRKSSDDMDAWITADSRRLPVKLEGKLPVGKVQCFYTGS